MRVVKKLLTVGVACFIAVSSIKDLSVLKVSAAGENIALNKPVTALSSQGDQKPSLVNDGDVSTYW